MRLMRLAVGGGTLAQREAQRMVAEKVTMLAEAQTAAVAKMITGRGMAAATKSASAIYRRKVRANRRRLARRGPGTLDVAPRDCPQFFCMRLPASRHLLWLLS
jgi:hypothetical protein